MTEATCEEVKCQTKAAVRLIRNSKFKGGKFTMHSMLLWKNTVKNLQGQLLRKLIVLKKKCCLVTSSKCQFRPSIRVSINDSYDSMDLAMIQNSHLKVNFFPKQLFKLSECWRPSSDNYQCLPAKSNCKEYIWASVTAKTDQFMQLKFLTQVSFHQSSFSKSWMQIIQQLSFPITSANFVCKPFFNTYVAPLNHTTNTFPPTHMLPSDNPFFSTWKKFQVLNALYVTSSSSV